MKIKKILSYIMWFKNILSNKLDIFEPQKTDYTCGPACVAYALTINEKKIYNEDDVKRELKTDKDGTANMDIVSFFERKDWGVENKFLNFRTAKKFFQSSKKMCLVEVFTEDNISHYNLFTGKRKNGKIIVMEPTSYPVAEHLTVEEFLEKCRYKKITKPKKKGSGVTWVDILELTKPKKIY